MKYQTLPLATSPNGLTTNTVQLRLKGLLMMWKLGASTRCPVPLCLGFLEQNFDTGFFTTSVSVFFGSFNFRFCHIDNNDFDFCCSKAKARLLAGGTRLLLPKCLQFSSLSDICGFMDSPITGYVKVGSVLSRVL